MELVQKCNSRPASWVCWTLIVDHPAAVLGMMQAGIAAPWSVTLEGRVDPRQPNKDRFRRGFQRGPCSAEAGRALGARKMFLREQMSLVSREGGASLPLRIWALRAVPPVRRHLALGVNDTRALQRAAPPRNVKAAHPSPSRVPGKPSPSRWSACREEAVWRGWVCLWRPSQLWSFYYYSFIEV